MRYNKWSFRSPPRPLEAAPKAFLPKYENDGWIAQVKMNGTCSIIGISPDRKSLMSLSRHNTPHKTWAATPEHLQAFENLPGDGWYVFVAELLHTKGNYRDINYIHDILVADGKELVLTTLNDRIALLASLFQTTDTGETSHTVIDDKYWLAKNHTSNFENLFENLNDPAYEGLVLKQPTTPMAFCFKDNSNAHWQLKIRRPTKNFGF